MSVTAISWTGTPLLHALTLARDVRLDGKVSLLKGTLPVGYMLPGFTHNPWIGCQKVSRACRKCFAESLVSGRMGYNPESAAPKRRLTLWGTHKASTRMRTSPENRKKPTRWNRIAGEFGVRFKVFCGSLMDVGEDHPDVREWRKELFADIDATPNLDWLLLTKRPHILASEWPTQWRTTAPRNVWAGATVEDQECADERVEPLLSINAIVHWLSLEPLAGHVNLDPPQCPYCREDGDVQRIETEKDVHEWCIRCDSEAVFGNWLNPIASATQPGINWGVCGGETGPGHETMELDAMLELHQQFSGDGVPFFCKQDSGPRAGAQGRIPDAVWNTKQFPILEAP